MAMGPERSKPLHNFTLPCGLKWGNQKFLRCAKVDSDGEISTVNRRSYEKESIGRRRESEAAERHRLNDRFTRKFRSVNAGDSGEGIGAMREKLMFDLQTEADKMKDAIFKEGLDEQPEKEVSPAPAKTVTAGAADVVDLSRPWNLRTRRAASKEPNGFITGAVAGSGGSKGGLKIEVNRTNASSPLRTENKSPIPRSGFAGGATVGASTSGEKRERVKFSVPLSRKEIEEDFMDMVGHRPPRRPKKRAKFVQKNLDTLFPGLWLTEITADLYKVPDDQ
ncbi:PREDICTED: uncharacterized protein LOC109216953 [Nicotiana attenuata]|uniref:DUF1639 domain-containing protein n=1 Tax=Nicotiana attenuata TaxID=49451 RepID=A0A1J6KMI6_NICAT|nr:PREDICTED: uncharacterized protein LOC109216953 [Nicotiana attenuata]XP_019236723.1 PREDICTED: uncharacterized protein LOC109216953 [Nicotiana attenuata]OIT22919.1 hypothetical protein A4A49_37368 [Nicotiana attenuata]